MSLKNENGSVLLEAMAAIFIFMVFAAGMAAVHRSYRNRVERIIQYRNKQIGETRKNAQAHPFPAGLLRVLVDGRNYDQWLG